MFHVQWKLYLTEYLMALMSRWCKRGDGETIAAPFVMASPIVPLKWNLWKSMLTWQKPLDQWSKPVCVTDMQVSNHKEIKHQFAVII